MKELRGKRVLLTGASAGLGPHIARRLREDGASFVLSARRRPELERLAAELGDSEVIPADMASAADVRRLAAEAGEIDVLIANAGLGGYGRLTTLDAEMVDQVLDVNLRAPIELTRLLLPAMVERRRGHVVLVASLAGKVPAPGSTLYSATKAGLRAFGHALAAELRGSGVGVTVISPTFVEEAGMFHDGGGRATGAVRTVSPRQVADAVRRGITSRKVEIVVAPVEQRLFGRVVQAVPEVIHTIAPNAGSIPEAR